MLDSTKANANRFRARPSLHASTETVDERVLKFPVERFQKIHDDIADGIVLGLAKGLLGNTLANQASMGGTARQVFQHFGKTAEFIEKYGKKRMEVFSGKN